MKIKAIFLYQLVLLIFAVAITGCSGSDDDNSSTLNKNNSITISGSVFAAPVNAASVVAQDANGNIIAGPVTTTDNGTYQINIPNEHLSSSLIFQSNGGLFDDEASGDTDVAAGPMAAYVAANALSAGTQVHMTPETTIVNNLVTQHGFSLPDAQETFYRAFGSTPDYSLQPVSAVTPDAGADDSQKLAGLRAAAFSQLALRLGLSSAQQFDLYTALAADLSDGTLDGKDAGGAVTVGQAMTDLPEDIQNQFVQALMDFRASGNDNTQLENNMLGQLPFAKVALTDNYRVEYVPGMMAAMEGKTQFKLSVTDRVAGTPVSGLSIMLMPMMYMAMHQHSTPVDGVVDNGDGTYTATVYYLMASSMMNGMSMGYWQLKVMLGGMSGETASFYPKVMMNMSGDSVQARLKGQNDLIPGMSAAENRTYYIFNSGVSGSTGNHSLDLFIAAKETMMSYPALESGSILNAGDADYELVISSVSVEVSADTKTWVSASETGNGYWTASGISGLTDGVEGTLYLRLIVNGEQKTTDGNAPAGDGSNDFAMFFITPGAAAGGM